MSRKGEAFVRQWAVASLLAVMVAAVSCGPRQGDSSRTEDAAFSVVVYCSADKEFAELIFRAYEAKTGAKILPLYDTEETKSPASRRS